MCEKISDYVEAKRDVFFEELKTFLRYPSVSADPAYKQGLSDCAGWLCEHLKGIGLESKLIETSGHPIVYGYCKGTSERTIIIYGHYDVQPPDPIDGWASPPFEPEVRDGYLYGRGSTDDKGQLFAHVKAVEAVLKTGGQLPCNIIFLIEGEEECGGEGLADYIKANADKLDVEAVIVSDCSMYDAQTPAITYALRGIITMEFEVRTASFDVHSGAYGGAIGNAPVTLVEILSKFKNADNVIQVPGFYDDVRQLEDWEREGFDKLGFDDAKMLGEIGGKKTLGEKGFSSLERMWARPTFDVNGMWGGYTDPGMKTIIPWSASAKVSFRLVPNQNPEKIVTSVKKFLADVCPDYAEVIIKEPIAHAGPVHFDPNDPMLTAGIDALRYGFDAEPVFIGCGGSIPVVNAFSKYLKKPVVLMGFGLDSDGAHSVNEKFLVESFYKGIKSSAYLISNI